MKIIPNRDAATRIWAMPLLVVAMLVTIAAVARAQADPPQYRIGYRVDSPPFSYRGENGPEGYTVELCDVIAAHLIDRLGDGAVAPGRVELNAGNRLVALAEGKVDVLCAATSVTLKRRRSIDFSIPIFLDGVTMAVRSDATGAVAKLAGPGLNYEMLRTAPPSAGLRLGVLGNTTTAEFVSSVYTGTEAPDIALFETHQAAFDALGAGEIDAYAVSLAIGSSYTMSGAQSFTMSPHPLTYEPIAIGIRRDDPDLRFLIDEALSQLYLDGGIAPIFHEHFGEGEAPVPSGQLLEGFFIMQALQ